MSEHFSIPAEYGDCFTRNIGPSSFPMFRIPLRIWDRSRAAFDSTPNKFLWDTGASFAVIGRELANDYSIDFDDVLDRIDGGFEGLGGNRDAWMTTMRVQFPALTRDRRFLGFGTRRDLALTFTISVVIVEAVGMPLLGISDILRNFTVTTTWDSCHFQLNADHLGAPVA